MKKHLSLIVRLLIVAAALAYIGYKLDWTDKLQYTPAGAGSEAAAPKPEVYRIVGGQFDPRDSTSTLRLRVLKPAPAGEGRLVLVEEEVTVTAGQRGGGPGQYLLRPGILTTLRHAHFGLLLLGLVLIGPIYPLVAVRWWLLMRARGIEVGKWKVFRLSMVGAFFNFCMPGSVSGDLVKAYYAAKGSDRRADTVMTVIFDRIVGLLALVLTAGAMGLVAVVQGSHEAETPTRYIWIAAGGVVAVSALYFSYRLRRLSGLDWLLGKLPPEGAAVPRGGVLRLAHGGLALVGKLDRAAVAYRDHKSTVVLAIFMSVPVQVLVAATTAIAGYALGMHTPFWLLMTVIPILFLVMAVPLSPQGFGYTEGLAILLLARPGLANANQIIVMLLLARLYQMLYSLAGSVFLLRGDIHVHPPKDEEEAEEARPVPVAAE